MSEKSAITYTVLHLRFKLRVPPDVLLAQSRDAATIIASVEGLIWKIWILREEEFEMGGMYLFARKRIEANRWKNVRVVVADARTVELTGMFDGLVMFAAPDVYASPEAIANLLGCMKRGARVVIFRAKLSNHRLGALPNVLLRMLIKLSFSSTPELDYDPLSALRNQIAGAEMREYIFGSMFLASGSVK